MYFVPTHGTQQQVSTGPFNLVDHLLSPAAMGPISVLLEFAASAG